MHPERRQQSGPDTIGADSPLSHHPALKVHARIAWKRSEMTSHDYDEEQRQSDSRAGGIRIPLGALIVITGVLL